MFISRNKRKGLSVLEYAVIFAVVVAALIAAMAYFKRSYQGKLRSDTDSIGKQFSPQKTTADSVTSRNVETSEDTTFEEGTVTKTNEKVTRLAKEEVAGLDKEKWWPEEVVDAVNESRKRPGTDSSGSNGSDAGSGKTGSGDAGNSGGINTGGTGSGSGGSGGSGSGGVGTGGTTGGTGIPDGQTGGGIGSRTYNSSIEKALEILGNSQAGAEYAALIEEKNISVIFLNFSTMPWIPEGTVAFWDPSQNIICVNMILQTASSDQAIAAVICHEATHADYSYNPGKWIDITKANHPELSDSDIHIPGNSIDQEYNSFKNAVLVWDEVKGNLYDVILTDTASSYHQGEAAYKAELAIIYGDQGLPQYWVKGDLK